MVVVTDVNRKDVDYQLKARPTFVLPMVEGRDANRKDVNHLLKTRPISVRPTVVERDALIVLIG
jgi:hypothetical protein